MKKVFSLLCIIGLFVATSACTDPNEDIWHDIDGKVEKVNTSGSDDGGTKDKPPVDPD